MSLFDYFQSSVSYFFFKKKKRKKSHILGVIEKDKKLEKNNIKLKLFGFTIIVKCYCNIYSKHSITH